MNNNAAVYNLGSDGWNNIELNSGGFELETDQVKSHGSQTFLLGCEKEGDGHITGQWIRGNYGIKFGYFTPNKDIDYEVFLDDNASIRYKQIIK